MVAQDQIYLQRIQSCKSQTQAKIAIWLQAPLRITIELMFMICALAIFTYYDHISCDPYRSKQISSYDQMLPYFVVEVFTWPGSSGLFMALLVSGSLSTVSSLINSCATLAWVDIICPLVPNAAPSRQARIMKLLSFIFGTVIIALAFLVSSVDMNLLQILGSWIQSLVTPLNGLIFLGAAFSCAQWKGACIGLLCSVALTFWINIGRYFNPYPYPVLPTNISGCLNLQNITHAASDEVVPHNVTTAAYSDESTSDIFILYRLSFLWIPTIGWCTTVFVGLLASVMTCPQKRSSVDHRTLIPWSTYFSCLFKVKPASGCTKEENEIQLDDSGESKPSFNREREHMLTEKEANDQSGESGERKNTRLSSI